MKGSLTKLHSVSTGKVIERQKDRDYNLHINNMKNMTACNSYLSSRSMKSRDEIMETFYKARKSAKDFKESEEKNQISKENNLMIGKIMKMNSDIKILRNFDTSQPKLILNKDKKRKAAIEEENERLTNCIIKCRVNLKEYKKKLEQDMEDYLKLRKSIRKEINISQKRELSRANSERIIKNLKPVDEDLRLSEKLGGMKMKNPESVKKTKASKSKEGKHKSSKLEHEKNANDEHNIEKIIKESKQPEEK